MNDKKKQILLAAIQLFGEKDYHTTSIQDIATLAGVSKGAFYLHFDSKEALLLSIYMYYYDTFITRLKETAAQRGITPQERIAEAIRLQCESIIDNKNFLLMQLKGAGLFENREIHDIIIRQSVFYIGWLQERIVELYGPSMKAYSFDCAVMLDGMLTQYFFLFLFMNAPIQIKELTANLIERLDDLAQGMMKKGKRPILSGDPGLWCPFLQTDVCKGLVPSTELKEWVRGHIGDARQAETMTQTIDAVLKELAEGTPNSVMIEGMLAYLRTLAGNDQQFVQCLDGWIEASRNLEAGRSVETS